ncbi:SDR family oxidoreductase [Acidisoma cellulosilytica]|uniref:SDR family oxidoreductase n=1 Tax=Acidisoma cellulosilyticum TaxID=2802395 RepID=A0A963Z6S9_9PROT|nr:SDR family oxidoreductase [Acidisoma cellulosilyticum]MCB8883867.1 SDR family oxidoreductase [Acidisoma cellulosilyticum]
MQKRQVKPGLRVLVTAGASGIGRAIADAFVEDGAKVHVCDVNESALAECAAVLGVSTSIADVSNEAQVERMVSEAVAALGGLDVLINNAGIAGPTGTVDEIATSAWRSTIDINLNGQFYCAHYAVPHLRAAGEGAIVNMSSSAGRFGYAYRTPYSASKWAIVGFTQSLAKELGPDGIRVNAILPGIVKGPRMEGVIRARAEQTGVPYEAMEAEYLQRISLRHMVTPDDIASAAIFLCTQAGWNISGQSIAVCGNVESL